MSTHRTSPEPDRVASPLVINRGLPAQAAELLCRCIESGRWLESLPSERRLCRELCVSRGTIRAALQILKRRNVITIVAGMGNRICARTRRRSASPATGVVGVLSPDLLEVFRPYFARRFNHLQELARLRQWRIQRVHGEGYFGARFEILLSRLVKDVPCECWMLMHSNERVQRWFEASGRPCIISGSPCPGISLPAADVDYRALARHATGYLLSLGHRRIGLLVARVLPPGLREGEAGFVDACGAHRGKVIRPSILAHDKTMAGIVSVLRLNFSRPDRPTALMIETSNQYIAAASILFRLGLRVPEDVSLISWIGDPFLEYIFPAPCRYVVNPRQAADVLIRLTARCLNGTIGRQQVTLIMPKFIRGGSTAPPKR